jgi:hypothetical protein
MFLYLLTQFIGLKLSAIEKVSAIGLYFIANLDSVLQSCLIFLEINQG